MSTDNFRNYWMARLQQSNYQICLLEFVLKKLNMEVLH